MVEEESMINDWYEIKPWIDIFAGNVDEIKKKQNKKQKEVSDVSTGPNRII
jgi:hypothetical protein